MIETERLVLRAYREEDSDAFAALTGDPRVGYWVANVKDRAQSDVMMDRLNAHITAHGYGLWGVARKTDDKIIGLCGLDPIAEGDLPVGAGVEMAWRMIPEVWRQGLASEAAAAALGWGLANLDVPEILAFTADTNLASQGVMRRIGMKADPARDFDHPRLAADHPLLRHVVYAARR
ncbi:MAG: GNAT family N-acetyltransferase [Phenylobacterium sp.]|uniref:GNAT family N-acetyltransferase n=1 Tax=Phenylobacterium sp. TaxID=1871053 RepID=UPI002724E39B|nr:GNAT family N-acetyltransferase [Phenylobacterium sp.]MDO9431970.1 GNAT family N-acetyltransferase [Phenylobacterium sp.]